jgi:cysteine-rich repeat protein
VGCGNGILEKETEECDDGNQLTNDDCTQCRVAFCGDGFVDQILPRTETCDTTTTSASCDLDCTPPECGDGFVNRAAGEECDNPGRANTRTCTADCKGSFCGDGFHNTNPEAGEECDDGAGNSNTGRCLPTCKLNVCGDGLRNPDAEACDDGNTVTEEKCPYGTASCTVCNSDCTAEVTLQGPVCGDSAIDIDDHEVCDDGNTDTEESCAYGETSCELCSADCKVGLTLQGARCGDGVINGPAGREACDSGALNNATECPYGSQSCQLCDSTCGALRPLSGPYCGDGMVTNGEACDDRNSTTETVCPYGPSTSCTVCSRNCQTSQVLPARYCGDRNHDAIEGEACDDGNSLACGTCSGSCRVSQPAAAATGHIIAVPANSISDGDFFTLNDGVRLVIFEFRKSGNAARGHTAIPIVAGTDEFAVALAIQTVINANSLNFGIAATADGQQVNLRNKTVGTRGNQISTQNAGGSIEITPMTGGLGRDCPSGTRCRTDDDCAPNLTCRNTGLCG